MASITRQTIGKYTYLYESQSYRDEQGRPRNRKEKIGKIDPETGRTIYTREYLEKMMEAGTPVAIPDTLSHSIDDLEQRVGKALESLRDYGVHYFLKSIAKKIKLLALLEEAFPKYWMEISTLAFYLIANDKPLMYCADWVSGNESFPVGSMSSQRISEILCAFGHKERNTFYTLWYNQLNSREYMALDITSISSYSKLINDCEWGYNRDGEELPQINLCMLFGEQSQLPVYQTVYSGSLNDVSTFKTTIEELRAISGEKPLVLVMDKGFYSDKNIKILVEKYHESEFLTAVPFTNQFAKQLVEQERSTIDSVENIIRTSGAPLRGIRRRIIWKDSGIPLYAHLLYNPERELKERNDLYAYTAWLKEKAEAGKNLSAYSEDVEKYLTILPVNSKKEKPHVVIRQKAVDEELATSGWVILIGNGDISTQKAHDVYRKKDVIEKGFLKYKNNLGLNRLRLHEGERMQNKLFVAFVALIVLSHIHKIMKEKDLYHQMTMDKLFLILSKLKIVAIDGHHILRPITKEQTELFSRFSIPLPLVG